MNICEAAGRTAAGVGSVVGRANGGTAAIAAAEDAEDGGIQFAHGVSGMERCAAAKCDEGNGAQSGVDGGGVRASAEVYAGEY